MAKDKTSNLEERLSNINKRLFETEKNFNALYSKSSSSEKFLDSLESSIDQMEKEILALRAKNLDLQKKSHDYFIQLSAKKSELNQSNIESIALKKDLETVNSLVKKLKTSHASIETLNNSIRTKLENQINEKKDLDKEFAVVEKAKENLLKEKENIFKDNTELKENIIALEAKDKSYEKLSREYEVKVKKLKKDYEKLEKNNQNLNLKNSELLNNEENLEKENKSLIKNRNSFEKLFLGTKAKLENLEGNIKELKSSLDLMSISVVEKDNHINNIQMQLFEANQFRESIISSKYWKIYNFAKKWIIRFSHPIRSSRNLYKRFEKYKPEKPQNYLESIDVNHFRPKTSKREIKKKYFVSKHDNTYKPEILKTICFYLPQFHEIKENNEWWGKGFTEWTNVKSAKPVFDGHYQPRVPHNDLGYYKLTNKTVLRKQTEAAKKYGIYGFCFYHYWFAGKRLLEKPVDIFIKDKQNDFPFCLCWANENWTRRWDGKDSDILIAQNHSEEDDINFIKDLKKYITDDRYIKINNKPLIIIYRPSLLPNAKETVSRWRKWSKDEGIGDIYLAYTQSFETEDPRRYGFDAAIEFPPNNADIQEISHNVKTKSDFSGNIWNWNDLLERSKNITQKKYKFFNSVTPSWDNTARKKNNASILIGNNPTKFNQWVRNAALNVIKNPLLKKDEKFLFVNAWNEWAEGAYLEPDNIFGYSYLNALKQGLISAEQRNLKISKLENTVGIVIHAFYPDVLEEIINKIKFIKGHKFKLYVSTIIDNEKSVNEILKKSKLSFHLEINENKGRDILPFIKIINQIKKDKIDLILKLHTKKTKHREDGAQWRNDLMDQLLSPRRFEFNIKKMRNPRYKFGIIGPERHVVSMDTYIGSNLENLLKLSKAIGVNENEMMQLPFVAGSMFFANIKIFEPILNLGLKDDDFDAEQGQVDGTIMHAIERLFTISAHAGGWEISSTEAATKATINESYGFAEASN